MLQCWIINLNYLHIIISVQASQSLKVSNFKASVDSFKCHFISRLFLKTRHIHSVQTYNVYIRYTISTAKLNTASAVTHESKLSARRSSCTALLTSLFHQNHNYMCARDRDIKLKFGDLIGHNSSIKTAH
jgi:hypothetical protein